MGNGLQGSQSYNFCITHTTLMINFCVKKVHNLQESVQLGIKPYKL